MLPSKEYEDQHLSDAIPCRPCRHIAKLQECIDAGYNHSFVHQIGLDQEGFFRFYQRDVLPRLR